MIEAVGHGRQRGKKEVADRVDLGFSRDDIGAITEIRRSPNNASVNARRLGATVRWLEDLELVGPDFQLWPAPATAATSSRGGIHVNDT